MASCTNVDFSVNVFRWFHFDNQTVSTVASLQSFGTSNTFPSLVTVQKFCCICSCSLHQIVLKNRRSTELHKSLFQQKLPDKASTFKPVAPVMKSTLAKSAHKSMISLQSCNTSLLNVLGKDEVCWRADYKVFNLYLDFSYFEAQSSAQEEKYLSVSFMNPSVGVVLAEDI